MTRPVVTFEPFAIILHWGPIDAAAGAPIFWLFPWLARWLGYD